LEEDVIILFIRLIHYLEFNNFLKIHDRNRKLSVFCYEL